MYCLYHLNAKVIYQIFKIIGRIHKSRSDDWSHRAKISPETVFFSYNCLQTEIFEHKNKRNSLWLSRWSCLGLLTRGWRLPAEFITACLHEYWRNTSSSTHNILILLSSPSLPPPSSPALICNRAHGEDGLYVYLKPGLSPFCVLVKPAGPLLFYWWTHLMDEA